MSDAVIVGYYICDECGEPTDELTEVQPSAHDWETIWVCTLCFHEITEEILEYLNSFHTPEEVTKQ